MPKEKDCDVCLSMERGYNKVPGLTRKYFYLCNHCHSKMRFLKDETLGHIGTNIRRTGKKMGDAKVHPSEPFKKLREKAMKDLIRAEYHVVMMNRYFAYRY